MSVSCTINAHGHTLAYIRYFALVRACVCNSPPHIMNVHDHACPYMKTGTLTFRTISPLSDQERISFQVEFQNPLRRQAGKSLSISGTSQHKGPKLEAQTVTYKSRSLTAPVLETIWKGVGLPPTQQRIDPSRDSSVLLPGGGGIMAMPAGAFPEGVEPVVTISPNSSLREGKYNPCPGTSVCISW